MDLEELLSHINRGHFELDYNVVLKDGDKFYGIKAAYFDPIYDAIIIEVDHGDEEE